MDQASLPGPLRQDLSWLSDSERARLQHIGSATRRHEYLAARFALRELLASAYPSTSWRDWVLAGDHNAAPAVKNWPDTKLAPPPAVIEKAAFERNAPPHLSLAHSAGLIAAAAFRHPVGIDIEVQRKARPIAQLADMVCSPEEAQRLQSLAVAEQAQAFYRIWTLKEAFFKRLATGLDWSMIRLLTARPASQSAPSDSANAAIWEGRHSGSPYTLSICCHLIHQAPPRVAHPGLPAPMAAGLWQLDLAPAT